MRPLTGELLLKAYEQGAPEHDVNRALMMLSLALPEANRQQLAALAVAERNLLLLRLRELSFGPTLGGFSICSRCGTDLEFALPLASLIAALEDRIDAKLVAWAENGRQYQLRAANSNDLLASLDASELAEAEDRLLMDCLTIDEQRAGAIPAATLPAVLEKFDQLHTASEVTCAVQCPECSQSETLDLDIARFLWLEVCDAARRLLREIHELAWAYGWSERAIARMSSQRRTAYMEMLST